MKKYIIIFICFVGFLFSPHYSPAQEFREAQKIQPNFTEASTVKKQQANVSSLSVHICEDYNGLKGKMASLNRSFSEYLKMDNEINEVFLKTQHQFKQIQSEQLSTRGAIAGTASKTSQNQIEGRITREQVQDQSPEVRRLQKSVSASRRLKDNIFKDLESLRQSIAAVGADIRKLSAQGLIPAESKQCLKRASSELDNEISRFGGMNEALKAQQGARNTNFSVSVACGSCDYKKCAECCQRVNLVTAAEGTIENANQKRRLYLCQIQCDTLAEFCSQHADAEDLWKKAMDALKDLNNRQTENSRNVSNL